MNISGDLSAAEESATTGDQLARLVADEIKLILSLPENENAYFCGALFVETEVNKTQTTGNQIEEMSIEQYSEYAGILSHEHLLVNSTEGYCHHSDFVNTISAGDKILILVGLEAPLGEICLIAAAEKAGLINEEESRDKINYFLERDGITKSPELELQQA